MKKTLSEQIATYGLLCILGPMILFHILVLGGVVPYTIAWGGRLTSPTEMIRFETISIISLLLMIIIVTIHAGILKIRVQPIVLKIAFGVMAGLFLLNTLGNMQSLNETERLIFTPVTFLLFLFSLRLVFSIPGR
ncbi:MAG TPA: hypothetical protein VGN63_00780 [Flavisolibacter sp.]|jgi:hypothetical protein|nr:hypothetical protein [Flavisolibacter sp.]